MSTQIMSCTDLVVDTVSYGVARQVRWHSRHRTGSRDTAAPLAVQR